MTEAPKITHTIELLLPDGVRAVRLLFTNQDSAQFAYERLSAAFASEAPICTVETATSTATVDTSKFLAVVVQDYIVHEMAQAHVTTKGKLVADKYSELVRALDD